MESIRRRWPSGGSGRQSLIHQLDFAASDFWNCRFHGELRGIMFRGAYLWDELNDTFGVPRKTGLHNVDFSAASFRLVGIRGGCVLENIKLPADGSAFLCSAGDLQEFVADFSGDTASKEILRDWFEIKKVGLEDQEMTIVSLHDIASQGEIDLGKSIYDAMKTKIEHKTVLN